MEVSVIIVNWNSVAYLKDCVRSIYEHTRGVEFEIIVVDNASPGGDAEQIAQFIPGITLIRSATNLGFGGASNLGFAQSSGRFVFFLNPDTILAGPALTIMLRHLLRLPDAGVIGCKLLNGDGTVQTSSIQKFPTVLNQVLQSERLRLRWPSLPLWGIGPLFSASLVPAKVEAISGACMMLRREVFAAAGLFEESYFMYAEDLDLCYKVRRAGFTNYYVGEARIIHLAGKSSDPDWALIMKCKADLRFCRRRRGPAYTAFFRAALIANAALRLAVIRILAGVGRVAGWDGSSLPPRAAKWRSILKSLIEGADSAARASAAKASRTVRLADHLIR